MEVGYFVLLEKVNKPINELQNFYVGKLLQIIADFHFALVTDKTETDVQ